MLLPRKTQEEFNAQVWLCEAEGTGAAATRRDQLQQQLVYGDHLTLPEKLLQHVEKLLLAHTEVFALSDYELGETDLVTHSVDTGNSPPVKALPHRLPYVLRQDLETEMQKLMDIGCIEPSSSPYASPLVLVRKKEGGIRVCVDYCNVNKNTIPD